jgi:VWFA-related protein
MRPRNFPIRTLFLLATLSTVATGGFAQQPQGSPVPSDEVIRTNTALVQTDVTVFDKGGAFVGDLKREQFVLKVDGKPREIPFFEQVKAGSHNEEAQLAAARGNPASSGVAPVPLDRGRTVFFFVDDLHISASSMKQTRDLLSRFISGQMGQNDEALITSPTGQIGFLQQLTNDKRVLRAAADRLKVRQYVVRDLGQPPMSEYQAVLVERQDMDVLNYFIDELIRQEPMLSRAMAEAQVHGRAMQMLQQSTFATTRTLESLERLIKSSSSLAGRKVAFLISDGFFLDNPNSDLHDRLLHLTSTAAAAGFVIYSIDARGLSTGLPDASTPAPFDPSGRLSRAAANEVTASQDGLHAIATDTGGRAFFNNNLLSSAVSAGLKESSVYYLLAWRPNTDEQRDRKFQRIEVSIVGRPELSVRFRRGFGEAQTEEPSAQLKNQKPPASPQTPIEELRGTLSSQYPVGALPVSLTLNFLDVAEKGSLLTTSVKIATNRLELESLGPTPEAHIDLAGVILDDEGRTVGSFGNRLTIKAESPDLKMSLPENLIYNHSAPIKPGLYQVRVAAREAKHGRAGSSFQWIEIPDLASKTLALSSLVVGESKLPGSEPPPVVDPSKPGAEQNPFGEVRLNVDHRFSRTSNLRFLTFVYNAIGTANVVAAEQLPRDGTTNGGALAPSSLGPGPDLAVQVQVFRDNEPVITDPLHKISVAGVTDLSRLPYAADLTLSTLQPGRYVLQVTVIDRLAKSSASQRFTFEVE